MSSKTLEYLYNAIKVVDEIKYVVGKPKNIEMIDTLLAKVSLKPETIIFLQTMSLSDKVTQLAIDVVKQRGWNLSIQIHKYINIS